jgi:hypothetical protein
MLSNAHRGPIIWLGALSLLAIALIGAVHIPFPFTSDQASFTTGSSMIHRGAVMYVDFWDIKQPGIYLFYLLGGSLFGFTERGMHVLELGYWLTFSIVLMWTLRNRFSHAWIVAALPLLTVGVYYSVAGPWALGQVESLIAFPLYLSLWCAVEYVESSKRRDGLLFVSGLAASVALLLKLMFLPIVVVFWAIAFIALRQSAEPLDARSFVRAAGAVFSGVALPIIVLLLYFAYAHALRELLLTWFVTPVHIATHGTMQDPHALLAIFRWLALYVSPLAVLSIIGAPRWMKSTHNTLPIGLVAWIVVGLLVAFSQTRSWGQYHFVVIIMPLGILSAYGLEALVEGLRNQRISPRLAPVVVVVLLGVLFCMPLRQLATKIHLLQKDGFAQSSDTQRAFFEAERPEYRQIRESSAFLNDPSSRPGPVFLIGGSLRYYLTGRQPATPIFGLPSFLIDRWADEVVGLERVRPPYAYIANGYINDIQTRAPKILQFIHRNYRVVNSDNVGTWYVLVH